MEELEQENKYYTPIIDEFHVGFEYEKYDKREATYKENNFKSTNWHKFKYDIGSIKLSKLPTYLYEKNIRVKYLDKEDIESLGFTYDKTSSKSQLKFFKDNLCLFYRPKSKQLGTFTVDPSKSHYMIKYVRDNKHISTLTIKNKSELKRLLKQLDI